VFETCEAPQPFEGARLMQTGGGERVVEVGLARNVHDLLASASAKDAAEVAVALIRGRDDVGIIGSDGTLITAQLGAETHETTGRSWSRVPGLYVSYRPIAATCGSGLIEVDLASYKQSKVVARAQHDANEPKM